MCDKPQETFEGVLFLEADRVNITEMLNCSIQQLRWVKRKAGKTAEVGKLQATVSQDIKVTVNTSQRPSSWKLGAEPPSNEFLPYY
jgi:hypothetical protein